MLFGNLYEAVQNVSQNESSNCTILRPYQDGAIISHTVVHALLVFIMTLLILFVVVGNTVILLALARSRLFQKLWRVGAPEGEGGVTVMLMGAMAFADLFLGVSIMLPTLIELAENRYWSRVSDKYMFRASLNVIWCTVSMYNMTSLAVDRYVAACRPFFYRSLSGRRKLIIFGVYIALPLIMSIISSLTGFELLYNNDQTICGHLTLLQSSPLFLLNSVICLYIPLAVMLVSYLKVFRQLKANFSNRCKNIIAPVTNTSHQNLDHSPRSFQSSNMVVSDYDNNNIIHSKQAHVFTLNPAPQAIVTEIKAGNSWFLNFRMFQTFDKVTSKLAPPAISDTSRKNNLKSQNDRNSKNGRLKAERTLALVIICFVVCWLPVSVLSTVSYFISVPPPVWLIILVTFLAYTNAALNAFLFCLHREVRQSVKLLLHIT